MRNDDELETEFEKGSGNVFADLGLEDADELFARAKLGFHVYKLLKDRNLKQKEITALLGIKQPEVSHLMNVSPLSRRALGFDTPREFVAAG